MSKTSTDNGIKSKIWRIADPAPSQFIERLQKLDIHSVLAQVLWHRGYQTPDEALNFLGVYDDDDNPYRLAGMVEAVYRLRMAIRHGESIAIYGDFDCDGVTSTVLLTEVLKKIGADVRPYIPDRIDEGYGLNSPALKTLADEGVKVVVTVDCGIRSVQEVDDGNSYGLDMIITDHHSIGKQLPSAFAVINPKREDQNYPERWLAGVGIAYKLAQGLYMEAMRRKPSLADNWHPSDWLDLVAIGTVADIAPLRGENRVLVQRGLMRLNRTQRPGLQALYNVAGIKPGRVSATTIGFGIGPRINAAGRLRSAMLAYELLAAPDMTRASSLAQQLNEINRERQFKTLEMQGWAEEMFAGSPEDEPLLYAHDPRFEQGVVGLVASRLTDMYYRPSVVIQKGNNESHGSCRSIPEFHITRALEQCEDLLERFGGHAAAAGFTVRNENIELLGERLWSIAAEQLADQDLSPVLEVDAELPLSEATLQLAESLGKLEPTGEANSTPLFMTSGLSVEQQVTVGKEGRHLKMQVRDGQNSVDAIAFRWGEYAGDLPEQIDILYHLEVNEWGNSRNLQLNVRDLRPTEV